jgi:hypothetical protein
MWWCIGRTAGLQSGSHNSLRRLVNGGASWEVKRQLDSMACGVDDDIAYAFSS